MAVVGLGLIGGSLAASLRRTGIRVTGFDRDPGHLRTAIERGLVDRTYDNLEDAVVEADTVIVAVPVLAIGAVLQTLEAYTGKDALLLDTGSVKVPVVEAMNRLRFPDRALGGHPIAGKERSGPAEADPDLFQGRPFVLTPTGRTSDAARRQAQALVETIGAVPVVTDAARHDQVLARTSHLPQLLATALASVVSSEERRLAGPAFFEMTRVASSDPGVWRDIFLANRENLGRAAREYLDELEALTQAVEAGDGDVLITVMRRGAETVGPPSRGATA